MHGRINAGSCRVVHIPETQLNFSPRPHCAGEEGADGGGLDLRVRGVQKKGVVVLGVWSVTRPQRCRGV